ncbi:hypothetical protein [Commensalibacter communis]|uniref:hypothetical protein n=1 Tax=Commensalibacter communis TaxID=2972786 RepID=UPI0022FF9B5B|nr:hypothetical protein [Commensalibacter communis]CAI3958849.1 unnamed protein product [Commensalibacter communis]CAI3959510.1 unnamed protein product [Commensalibacter communis]
MDVTINSSNLNTITGKLDDIKSAISNIKVTVNASFSDAQGKFNQALNNAVDASLKTVSTKFGGFWAESITKMRTDITTVEQRLGDQIQKVKTVTKTLESKSTSSAINFEDQRLKLMQRQTELMGKQEQAFGNFKNALSQVAQSLMTVPRLLSDSAKAAEKYNIVEMTRTQRQTYAVSHDLMHNQGVNEGVANGFYINTLAPMIKSKYEDPEQFKKHPLVQLATGEGGDTSILNKTDEHGKAFDEVEIEKRIFAGISKRLRHAEELQKSNNPEQQMKGNLLEKEIRDTVNQVVFYNPNLAKTITDKASSGYLESRKKDVQQFIGGQDPGHASGRQADLENTNFYNTIKALDKANIVFDAYYNIMESLLKQFPDVIAIAKDVSAFGLAIAGVVPIVHGLFGGFSKLFELLKGAGLVNLVKEGAGKVVQYGKNGAKWIGDAVSGGGSNAIRGVSSAELLETGGAFALRSAPWLMALALKGDTMQTPEQLEKEIQYKRQNAFKEMKANQQEVAGYEKRFGEKVNYYDDDRGFVLQNQFGGSVVLGQSLELVKHTMHELQANQKKTEAVEKATGLHLTFHAPAKHFVLINDKGQIVYDIGKKLKASQEDIIKGAQDAQKPSMWYPPNWFKSSNSEKIEQKDQGKLSPILRTSAMQSSPVFRNSSDNSNTSPIRQTNGRMASALQYEKQLANTTNNVTNSDQRFSFNIHLSALTNDFTPLKQWFQHELPTMLKQIRSPVFMNQNTVDQTRAQH